MGKIDVLKNFEGFQLSGRTNVEIDINGKKDDYCVPWLITGNRDKIIFSICDYQEEISSDLLERIADGSEINFVRYACERYVVKSAYQFLNSTHNFFLKVDNK